MFSNFRKVRVLSINQKNKNFQPNCLKNDKFYADLHVEKLDKDEPILVQFSISIPPENVRKPKVSGVFTGYENGLLD